MAKPDANPDLPDVEDDLDEDRDDALDDDLDANPDEGDDEDGAEDDAEDADDEEPLGDKGRKALDRMKAERRELRKQIRELKATVEELRNADPDEEDELTSARKAAETEKAKRLTAERKLAAKQAGLPASWADRLQGEDFEDFLEDAEALAEDMPSTPRDRKGGGGAKDGRPKPRKQPSLDEQIAQAEKDRDFALARQLKAQKVHELRGA